MSLNDAKYIYVHVNVLPGAPKRHSVPAGVTLSECLHTCLPEYSEAVKPGGSALLNGKDKQWGETVMPGDVVHILQPAKGSGPYPCEGAFSNAYEQHFRGAGTASSLEGCALRWAYLEILRLRHKLAGEAE